MNISISDATGMELDRLAELVGLRRGYEKETDKSLRERTLKRITNLGGETLRGEEVKIVKKSRYELAKE